jgi:hypothetical protein
MKSTKSSSRSTGSCADPLSADRGWARGHLRSAGDRLGYVRWLSRWSAGRRGGARSRRASGGLAHRATRLLKSGMHVGRPTAAAVGWHRTSVYGWNRLSRHDTVAHSRAWEVVVCCRRMSRLKSWCVVGCGARFCSSVTGYSSALSSLVCDVQHRQSQDRVPAGFACTSRVHRPSQLRT